MMETDQPDGRMQAGQLGRPARHSTCRPFWVTRLAPFTSHLQVDGECPDGTYKDGGCGAGALPRQRRSMHLCAWSRNTCAVRPSHRPADNNPYCYRPCSVFNNTPVQGVK